MRVNSLEVERKSTDNSYPNGVNYNIQKSNISSETGRNINLRLVENYEDKSDFELVGLFVLENDELAFNEIFNRYYQKVKTLALKILANQDEAKDIVQEVFVTLVKKMNSFRGESKFSTWLYSITLNTVRMRLREKIKDRNSISIDDDTYINYMVNLVSKRNKNGSSNNPEDIYINHEFVEKLHQALETLPEKYKDAFVLRDMNQLSNQEVADQLGVTLAAVKSRVHRARRYLKNKL